MIWCRMLKAALSQLERVFSPQTLKHAFDYQAQGHVLNLRLSDGLLKARVKGDSNQIFNVHFDLKSWPATPASCSCPQARNCEHVAACLIALQQQDPATRAENVVSRERYSEEIIDADDVDWYSQTSELSTDFFSYQLGVLINQEAVSLVPVVSELLRRWDKKTLEGLSDKLLVTLPIKQGKVLKIELGRLKPILRFLLEHQKSNNVHEESIQLQNHQLLIMLEAERALEASRARWEGTDVIRQKLNALSKLNELPEVTPPQGLSIPLRDYQQQGLNWLQGLREGQFGGILADDMGLGKTVQTLAHLQYEKEKGRMRGPCLIVAPTSLLGNWFEEAKRFTPGLKVAVYHGSKRHKSAFKAHDLIVTTYALIQRDKRIFLEQPFYYLILDEAQFIKNARTKTTQIIQQIKAQNRLCLTGTPLENHLGELWSLFHFLMPGFLGQAKQFRSYFKMPIEKNNDEEQKQLLARRVQPFMLRRRKNEVLKELPEKTEVNSFIELSHKQRDLYEVIRISMEQKIRAAIASQGLAQSQMTILDALLKLRQICCDPRLLSLADEPFADKDSAKLEALMELLENLIEEGRCVLIFSQFTSMLAIIEEQLKKHQYSYLKLTGKTQNRQALVNQFQAGDASIFLISLKAGGTGLNLTRADTVIHYDPWWNPAVMDQATDRSHRFGQDNPVFVYKLIAKGTVEEAILHLQEKKRQLVSGILSTEGSGVLTLTEEEISRFFKPLDDA